MKKPVFAFLILVRALFKLFRRPYLFSFPFDGRYHSHVLIELSMLADPTFVVGNSEFQFCVSSLSAVSTFGFVGYFRLSVVAVVARSTFVDLAVVGTPSLPKECGRIVKLSEI